MNLLDEIFIFLGVSFFIEQIFCWVYGSYPYRHGFIIKTVTLPDIGVSDFVSMVSKVKKIGVKKNPKRNEAYVRYKYPALTAGPILFVGQIKSVGSSRTLLHIRIGPLAVAFVLFLVVYSFFSPDFKEDPTFQVMNILLLLVIVAFFYSRLWNPLRQIMKVQPRGK